MWPPCCFGAIVTDPPFGLRSGARIDLVDLYRKFLEGARRVLHPSGTLVMLVGNRRRFTSALRQTGGFSVRQARAVETSGVVPKLYVLERKEG